MNLPLDVTQEDIDKAKADSAPSMAVSLEMVLRSYLNCRERQLDEMTKNRDHWERNSAAENRRAGDALVKLTTLRGTAKQQAERLKTVLESKRHTGIIPCPQDYQFYIQPLEAAMESAIAALGTVLIREPLTYRLVIKMPSSNPERHSIPASAADWFAFTATQDESTLPPDPQKRLAELVRRYLCSKAPEVPAQSAHLESSDSLGDTQPRLDSRQPCDILAQ